MSLLYNRGLQIILLVSVYIGFIEHIPFILHNVLYSFSLIIKNFLLLLMPIVVSVFIATTIDSFKKQALIFVAVLFSYEAISNFATLWYSYFFGMVLSSEIPSFASSEFHNILSPIIQMPNIRPSWWNASNATIIGLIFGVVSAFSDHYKIQTILYKARALVEIILIKIFGKIIPIYIVGCIVNIYFSGALMQMISSYGILLIYLTIGILFYIFIVCLIGNYGDFRSSVVNFKNVIPASLMGFTTTCSISTMPWTISGASKNLKDPEFAKLIIPATTNVQQIGDNIVNAFFCFVLYKNFFGVEPGIEIWLFFAVRFVLTRFITAAVTGGSIFIMIIVYKDMLNFTDPMIAIILAVNAILDPLVTAGNVLGNAASAKIFENIWSFINRNKKKNV